MVAPVVAVAAHVLQHTPKLRELDLGERGAMLRLEQVRRPALMLRRMVLLYTPHAVAASLRL